MNLVWVSISLWGTFALPGQGYITIRKCARNPRKKTNYNIFSVKTFVRQTTAQWKPLNHITFKWNLYFLFLSIQGIHSSEGFGEEVINTCECKTVKLVYFLSYLLVIIINMQNVHVFKRDIYTNYQYLCRIHKIIRIPNHI